MRRVSLPYVPLLLSLTLFVHRSPAQFEGIVETKNFTIDETGTPQNFTITMWIRKDMVRIQSSAVGETPPATMIYRSDKGMTWVLNDSDRTYTEMPRGDIPMDGTGLPGTGSREKFQVKKTGKTRKIAGIPCEQIIFRRDGEETEIWGTRKLRDLDTAITSVLGTDQTELAGGWIDELGKLGVYPLEASTKVSGKVVESQQVVRIERRAIAPELFELPAGYTKEAAGGMERQ